MARTFPGTANNYLHVGDVAALDITGTALTICAWVKAGTVSGDDTIASKTDFDNLSTRQYGIRVRAGQNLEFHIGDSGGRDFVESTGLVTAGVWKHVAGRKNGTDADSLLTFIDGAQQGVNAGSSTSTRSIQNGTWPFRIGTHNDGDEAFTGDIAEVAVWNIALTNAEIAAIAEGVSPRTIRPQNLKGYWPLYGTGSPEPDYSGQGNHATMTGAVDAADAHAPAMPFVFPTPQIDAGGVAGYADEGLVYVDLQPSGADIQEISDLATVYVDLQPSGVDVREVFDSATVYVDIQPLGGECHSTFSAEQFGEGEAWLRWISRDYLRWTATDNLRWSAVVSVGEQIHC